MGLALVEKLSSRNVEKPYGSWIVVHQQEISLGGEARIAWPSTNPYFVHAWLARRDVIAFEGRRTLSTDPQILSVQATHEQEASTRQGKGGGFSFGRQIQRIDSSIATRHQSHKTLP